MTAVWTHRLLWLIPLAAVAAMTVWLQDTATPVQLLPENGAAQRIPDYAMENFTVTEMRATGEPAYKLQATQLDHFADDNSAHMTQPRVELYNAERVPWTLTADAGDSTGETQLLHLRGDVAIERPATEQRGWLRINTHDVLVKPNEEYAETAAAVTITDPLSTTQARGMRVYMRDERVNLLAEVRGTYAAQ